MFAFNFFKQSKPRPLNFDFKWWCLVTCVLAINYYNNNIYFPNIKIKIKWNRNREKRKQRTRREANRINKQINKHQKLKQIEIERRGRMKREEKERDIHLQRRNSRKRSPFSKMAGVGISGLKWGTPSFVAKPTW